MTIAALAWAALGSRDRRLDPEQTGLSAEAVRLREPAFKGEGVRGGQFLDAPISAAGVLGTISAPDGAYWNLELRALVRSEARERTAAVGLVFR